MTRRGWLIVVLVLLTTAGCIPRTFVRKNPAPNDKGIRYYRPKPYLKIAPFVNAVTGEASTSQVAIDLVYMPDFAEEYAIHVRSGFGVNNTSITLDQGWNLTALNVELDSQTDENLTALGSLVGSLPGAALSKGAGSADSMVVTATNVPLGFYEAVLGQGPCGKQLYGFRYVGFMPFATCPTTGCGNAGFDCQAGEHELYGLVFENGTMTFKTIGAIRHDATSLNLMQKQKRADAPAGGDRTASDPGDDGMVPAQEPLKLPEPSAAAASGTTAPEPPAAPREAAVETPAP